MRSKYIRDVHNNFLVIESDKEVEEFSYPVRMLLANVMPLLLKCRMQNMDGKRLFYYEITSKQSMEDMFENKKYVYQDIRFIYENFLQLIERMAEYMLNPDQLVLQPEFIFMDGEKKNMFFCYLPGYEKPIRDQFQSLTEYVLPKLDHEDSRAVMLGYGIYRKALEDIFQLEHLKEEVYQNHYDPIEEKKGQECAANSNEESSFFLTDEKEEEKIRVPWQEESWLKEEKKRTNRKKHLLWTVLSVSMAVMLLLTVTILGYMGYLPVLEVEIVVGAILILILFGSLISWVINMKDKNNVQQTEEQDRLYEKEDNNYYDKTSKAKSDQGKQDKIRSDKIRSDKIKSDKIKPGKKERKEFSNEANIISETVILCNEPIHGPATLVSREPGELATIYLQNELTIIGKMESAADAVIMLPTISRLHAKVRKRDGEYFLSDLNSRNGTSVNGRMLKVDEEYMLQNEDEVDFAQARYIFLK